MKEIYLLVGVIEYEGDTILGVYTTKEKALKQRSIASVDKDIKETYNEIAIVLVETNKNYEILGV